MAAGSLFTLSDLAVQVAQNYGDTSDTTIAKAEQWINRALLRIDELGDWSWLMKFDQSFSTTYEAGTDALTIGVSTHTVNIGATISDTTYTVTATVNANGGSLTITPTVTAQTSTTFTVSLDHAPDTANYTMTWNISQESYTLAAGVKKIYAVYFRNSNVRRKLRAIDDRRFREVFTYNVTPQGNPLWYRFFGRDSATGYRKIALWPVPNSITSVYYDYRKEISLLSASTDDVRVVTGMPDHMVDALIELATAISFRELDDSDYESAMGEAIARLQKLLAEDLAEIDDGIRMKNFETDYMYFGDPVLPPQYGDFLG